MSRERARAEPWWRLERNGQREIINGPCFRAFHRLPLQPTAAVAGNRITGPTRPQLRHAVTGSVDVTKR
jgi:hypothetical protein